MDDCLGTACVALACGKSGCIQLRHSGRQEQLSIQLSWLSSCHVLNLHQYASDTQVYISTLASDIEAAVRHLAVCLVDIKAWLKASRLLLNCSKTQIMWLSSPQQLAKVNFSEIPIASLRVIVSETSCDLGIVIKLTVSSHLHRWPLYVAAAAISYGSSDHSSDPCHLMP